MPNHNRFKMNQLVQVNMYIIDGLNTAFFQTFKERPEERYFTQKLKLDMKIVMSIDGEEMMLPFLMLYLIVVKSLMYIYFF